MRNLLYKYYPNQYKGNQVILNAGRLLLNSKSDHLLLSSNKSINLNAQESVKDQALMVTEKSGGNGAVREVCNFLLKSQDKYDALVKSFLK